MEHTMQEFIDILGRQYAYESQIAHAALQYILTATGKDRLRLLLFLIRNFKTTRIPESNNQLFSLGISQESLILSHNLIGAKITAQMHTLYSIKKLSAKKFAREMLKIIEGYENEADQIFIMTMLMFDGPVPYKFLDENVDIGNDEYLNIIHGNIDILSEIERAINDQKTLFRGKYGLGSYIYNLINGQDFDEKQKIVLWTAALNLSRYNGEAIAEEDQLIEEEEDLAFEEDLETSPTPGFAGTA